MSKQYFTKSEIVNIGKCKTCMHVCINMHYNKQRVSASEVTLTVLLRTFRLFTGTVRLSA